MQNSSVLCASLAGALMCLRDPRCDDPSGRGSYVLGMMHGMMLEADQRAIVFKLLTNARGHHYAGTPWPEVKPYAPF